MAKKLKMFRGDAKSFVVKVPIARWSAGGKLLFAAKPSIDDDTSDTSAVVKKTLIDSNITATTATNKEYTLSLTGADTTIMPGTYLAEFQFVDAAGKPATYEQFNLIIEGDVNRRTA